MNNRPDYQWLFQKGRERGVRDGVAIALGAVVATFVEAGATGGTLSTLAAAMRRAELEAAS
jgi:threonine/homoserine/homoserine lactone efflux protein